MKDLDRRVHELESMLNTPSGEAVAAGIVLWLAARNAQTPGIQQQAEDLRERGIRWATLPPSARRQVERAFATAGDPQGWVL